MDRLCVYTCITGDYDNLREIQHKEDGIDYYCFTNNKNLKSDTWNIVYIEDKTLSNTKLARKIKILGHPIINEKYNILIWMDAAVIFMKNIRDFVNYYLKEEDNLVAFKHGERTNIKDEAYECLMVGKETKENITNLLEFYEKENYQYDNGLIEATVFIKRCKNHVVIQTMQLWFDMVNKYSKRDQLSFNYCIYKTGLKVKWIEEKVFDNDWFDWINHNIVKSIEEYRIVLEKNGIIIDEIKDKYKIENNKYKIEFDTTSDYDTIFIFPCKIPCTFLKNVNINDKAIEDYEVINYVNYKGFKVFYNATPIIKIKKQVQKNNRVKIDLEMITMEDDQKASFLEKICISNVLLKGNNNLLEERMLQLSQKVDELSKAKDIIENSRCYKLFLKFSNIKNKLFK